MPNLKPEIQRLLEEYRKKTMMWSVTDHERTYPEQITDLSKPVEVKNMLYLEAILKELRAMRQAIEGKSYS